MRTEKIKKQSRLVVSYVGFVVTRMYGGGGGGSCGGGEVAVVADPEAGEEATHDGSGEGSEYEPQYQT